MIDVALTETARLADYVLPAATQYEKYEATFFNFDFPRNVFHLRRPLLDPPDGVLAEPEIHARLVEALGALTDDDLAPLRAAAADGRAAFADAFFAATAANPELGRLAPVVLYRTLGPTLPDGAASAAILWGAAQRCAMANPDGVRRAGHEGEGLELGEALFDAILASPSGVVITDDDQDETWRRVGTDDGRIHLALDDLLDELATLGSSDPPGSSPEWPFVLSAGERRSFTANTIIRDPSWRKKDPGGALRVSVADADRLGLVDGRPGGAHHPPRGRGGRARGHRDHAGRPHLAAQRVGSAHPGRRRRRRRADGHRAERADGVGGPRSLRGHAVAQARARPARAGGGAGRHLRDRRARAIGRVGARRSRSCGSGDARGAAAVPTYCW